MKLAQLTEEDKELSSLLLKALLPGSDVVSEEELAKANSYFKVLLKNLEGPYKSLFDSVPHTDVAINVGMLYLGISSFLLNSRMGWGDLLKDKDISNLPIGKGEMASVKSFVQLAELLARLCQMAQEANDGFFMVGETIN